MAKKTVTSWKSKKLYILQAPDNFDKKEIGTTLSADPEKLAGRTVQVSLGDLMNDRSKNYLNLRFEVYDVKGDKALTRFKKFFIPTGYLRSKVRKKTLKIDYGREMEVEGDMMRFKIMVLSRHKVSEVQKADIKKSITRILEKHTDSRDKVLQAALFGKLGTEIYKDIKKICPVTRVEVYQIEMLR
ncbi:MAG: hypothetical protein GF416_05975 [Candidatus Altiarchaeales archaeon]|nr:hypothetical protein [Candidatus Altiarchaeales archaeon]MBD3416663.1 hypothetical protein [Candidatus Altiarchaeales archaeon]